MEQQALDKQQNIEDEVFKFTQFEDLIETTGPVKLGPGESHSFSTRKKDKLTTFTIVNSDKPGKLKACILHGLKCKEGDVKAGAKGSSSQKGKGQVVTFSNTGKSTFTITSDY